MRRTPLAVVAPLLAALALVSPRSVTHAQSPRPGAGGAGQDRRPTVAVIQFTNSSLTNHAEYEPLSKGMPDLLGTTLRGNSAIRVVEREALQAVLREQDLATQKRVDDATAAKLGQLLGARYLIKGTFFIEPKGRVRIVAQAVNSTTGQLEFSESANGTTEDLLAVIDALATKFSNGLKLGELPLPARRTEGGTAPSGSRWAALMTYSRALEAEDRGDRKSALAYYQDFVKQPVTASYASQQRTYAEAKVKELGGGS